MKKIIVKLAFCIGILLATATQGYTQDFWKGRIIASPGNGIGVYSLVDGSIYKFNSASKVWEKKGSAPNAGGFGFTPKFQLDDRGYIWSVNSDGVLTYSKNEAASWDVFGKNPTGNGTLFKVLGDYVYSTGFDAGTTKTYRKKADGTGDWLLVNTGDYPEDMTVTANGDIYFSIYNFKVLKSSNNGATWTNTGGVDFKFTSTPGTLTSIGNKVFVGTYFNGVYYSDDGGVVWKSSTGFPTGQNTFTGSRGVSRIVARNENEVFALVKDQLAVFGWYKSNDGGLSFQPMTFSYNRWVVRWLDEMGLSGNDIIVSSDYRGFFHTSNAGTSWAEVNNGVNNLKPHHVSRMMKNTNNEFFALMTQGHLGPGPGSSWGLLKSTDNGVSWAQIDDQLDDEYNTLEDLLVARNGHLYVTTYQPGTYRKSKDNGVTWQKTTIPAGPMSSGSSLTMLKDVGVDSILIASYFNNMWRTYDGGANWTELVIKAGSGVMSFDTKGKNIYAISKDQVAYNGLYKSTDLGNNWLKINVNGTQKFDRIKIFGSSLYATSGAALYRSDDDGVNWTNITPVIEGNNFITSIEIVPTNPSGGRTQADEGNLFLGTYAGLYTTSLQTTQWKKIQSAAVYSLGMVGNQVYVATEAGATVKSVSEALKVSQSITFTSLPAKAIGDAAFQISATATSGLPVTFASSNPNVATISGSTVTVVAAGTTQITASQIGNTTYSAAAPTSRVLVVSKKSQTITFNTLSVKDVNDIPFTPSATSSAGLAISFSSDNALVATVSGNLITIKGLGTAKITASQAGNDTFGAAEPVTRNLTVVAKTNQTVSFTAIPDKTLGDAAFALTATATSSLPVTFNTTSDKIEIAASQVTLVKAGRVTVTANQAGNETYNAAPPVERSFCIKPAKPTIVLSGAGSESPTLTSSASTGNQWYKDGTAITGSTGNTLVATTVGIYKVQVKVDDCVSEFSSDVALIVTGVTSSENIGVTLYPNPVEDYFELTGISGEITGTQLFDMTGRNTSLVLENRNGVHRGNVQQLAPGLYVLRIQEGNSTHQVKLVKR